MCITDRRYTLRVQPSLCPYLTTWTAPSHTKHYNLYQAPLLIPFIKLDSHNLSSRSVRAPPRAPCLPTDALSSLLTIVLHLARRNLSRHKRHTPLPRPKWSNHRRQNRRLRDSPDAVATHIQQPVRRRGQVLQHVHAGVLYQLFQVARNAGRGWEANAPGSQSKSNGCKCCFAFSFPTFSVALVSRSEVLPCASLWKWCLLRVCSLVNISLNAIDMAIQWTQAHGIS